MKLREKSAGFTLIELLVVISIIGLLSTLAVVSFGNARKKSRDSKRVSDIKQIQTALELYFGDKEVYPGADDTSTKNLGETNAKILSSDNGFSDTSSGTKYMDVPHDPITASQHYVYTRQGSGASYQIIFSLEGATGELASGAHTATPSGIQR